MARVPCSTSHDEGAAVVPGEREAILAQCPRERDDVGGHGALGVGGAEGSAGLSLALEPRRSDAIPNRDAQGVEAGDDQGSCRLPPAGARVRGLG